MVAFGEKAKSQSLKVKGQFPYTGCNYPEQIITNPDQVEIKHFVMKSTLMHNTWYKAASYN